MVPALMVPARNRRSVERLFIMSDASPHLRRGEVCISLIVLLNLHLKLRTQQDMITKLARAIALANVVTPHEDVMGAVPDVAQPQTGAHPAARAHTSTQMDDQIA
jgi:hypothetical protein